MCVRNSLVKLLYFPFKNISAKIKIRKTKEIIFKDLFFSLIAFEEIKEIERKEMNNLKSN